MKSKTYFDIGGLASKMLFNNSRFATTSGEMDEEFPYQQKLVPLLLAQEKNWEEAGLLHCNYPRKGSPHFWKGENTVFRKK